MKMNNRKQFLSGAKAGIPVVCGFIPVGVAYAIAARSVGFNIIETVFMSASVFAGASQMMATEMYAQGASIFAIILATLIINLRHVIMSTCVFNKIRNASLPMKLLAAFGVTDESFAVFTANDDERLGIWYFLGLIAVTYSSWVFGSFLGAAASDFMPEILSKSFEIALSALFLSLIVPSARKSIRLTILIVVTAICNSVLLIRLDRSWSIIISTLVMAAVGVFFVDLEEAADEN